METNAQYFDCLCRTCMNKVEASSQDGTTKPQQQWLSISDIIEECGALRIAELLSDAVPQLLVYLTDELPKKICHDCLQQLLSAYRFQQMCVRSDKQMHELLAKKQTILKTPMLKIARKGETETNGSDSQPLKDLACSSTLQNLQQPSIQEPHPDVTVQTIEPEAAPSSAAEHLQDNTQLLEHCNDSQGEFEEFIKNEPIEDDAANNEYSDGATMHSTITVTKEEAMELADQQVYVTSIQYSCHLCNKSYKKRAYLTKHLNDHKKKANNSEVYCYACHLCSESYQKRRYLTMHLNLAHYLKPQRYTCDVCDKSFRSPSQLRQHKRKHTGERPYVCADCGKSFTAKSSLTVHLKTHYEDRPYKCPYCPLEFSSKSHMLSHKATHEGIKPHKCDICGKNFSRKSLLRAHKLYHSEGKQHKCEFCEMRFAHPCHLLVHNRLHTGEKPYKCKYCEQAFTRSGALTRHSRRHLGDNIYRCKFCPLAFPAELEMRVHLTTHRNEDPEVRERNMKALREEVAKLESKLLKERVERESKEEQQQQNLSNKKIQQPLTDIIAEQRTTHSEDKSIKKTINKGIERHKCSICEKKFRQKSDLMRHKRMHSKEKPHECDLCEKRFSHKQPLKIHLRTHTGEKPYKCKYCERRFAAPNILHNHLRGHLGKNIHRCKLCPLAFPLAAELRLHLPSHKNEDPETRERNMKALMEEEAKLELKLSQEKYERQSTEEQQQQKLSNKEIEQPSTERGELEEFIKNKPIEDDKSNWECSDGDTMNSTISVAKNEALSMESEYQQVNETRDELKEFIKS